MKTTTAEKIGALLQSNFAYKVNVSGTDIDLEELCYRANATTTTTPDQNTRYHFPDGSGIIDANGTGWCIGHRNLKRCTCWKEGPHDNDHSNYCKQHVPDLTESRYDSLAERCYRTVTRHFSRTSEPFECIRRSDWRNVWDLVVGKAVNDGFDASRRGNTIVIRRSP